MSIKNEVLCDEHKLVLRDYANHIDLFVQRIGSSENVKIYNSYSNFADNESFLVKAMIYKIYQNYAGKLIDFNSPIPDVPQVVNTKVMIHNINKRNIPRFIKQNDLDLPFFALIAKASSYTKPVIRFEDKEFLQNFLRKMEIRHIKKRKQIDIGLLEFFEKETWKTIRDKIKAIDSLKL